MTSDNVRFVTACRVCGGEEWQQVISFGDVPLANGFLEGADSAAQEQSYPLEVISCRGCRLLSLTAVVDPRLLYRTYSYVTSDSETMARHMRTVVRLCSEGARLADGDLVVELGSNTGDQLLAFQEVGARVLGVDPARNLTAIAEDRGVPTVPEYFGSVTAGAVAAEHGRAKLILGRHVFAHIDDVADVLAGVRALLADDGLFTIEVPYAVDLVDGLAFDTIYHEHLSYFLISTLDTLFARHGLRTVDVERLAVHGGSVLVSAGLAEGTRTTGDRVRELIAHERSAGLLTDAVYEDFAARVRGTCDGLRELVRGLVAGGSRVAGYGASAKGTTLLNMCGLGRDELEFCTDTTPQKQGRLTPGTHLPVLAPEDVERQPDYYLLLAWNYAEEIMRKESAFLDAGGGFVVPVPEPTVRSRAVSAS
ncbi:class I SAM-dependent methyltransferase [Streptomyces uncialis]|uniref:SAM-dependent methyltransferase n=1 Tax=Streptomyces uncialis TaxID=1048205 RepID=A0A1Q4V858_9ACTN|nr:class I SAM-dependent methyltransferase [Streptomyces uncialis]OKH94004.1 SAM-dependent methyltransferase [Streptomyces uncialis]WTE09079.1 class I SAM-dependent methyltransferase [Streptomyces uncialis]